MDRIFNVLPWMKDVIEFLADYPWMKDLIRIVTYFLVAWVFQRFSRIMIKPFLNIMRLKPGYKMNPERKQTLESLLSSGFTGIAYLIALLASIGLFVDVSTLAWTVGLFSAAFGLGARPIISDILTGIGFIFEDTFSVGEKVEVLDIEGVIEEINLRTTLIRAPSGELYVIPNGEIRTIRNFSRGRFSMARVYIKINAVDLSAVLNLLEKIKDEAVLMLPNMLETWQVLSEEGSIGQHTQLTLLVKTRYGRAAELQPRLLSFLHEKFSENDIHLMD